MRVWGRNLLLGGALSAFVAMAAGPALAGGFGIKERSTPLQGTSFAGASAGGGGLTSMGFNPAALGMVEGTELAGGLSLLQPIAEGEVRAGGIPTGEIVTADQIAGLSNGYLGHRLSEDIVLGLSIYTPFGLVSKYPAPWTGRGDGITSKLQTIQISPTIAYQPIPELTIAGQFHILYINARLTSSTAVLDADQINAGFAAGIMWDVTDSTTIGAAYQHGYNNRLVGTAQGPGTGNQFVPLSATAELPATVSAGIVQEFGDDFRVMVEGQWQNWSVFDRLDITLSTPMATVTQVDPQNYEDAFFVALGGEYDVLEGLTVRTGVAWDQTPTNSGILPGTPAALGITNRTVRVPDEDRFWLSAGFSYSMNEHMTMDFGYSFLFGLDKPVVGLRTAPGSSVVYDAGVHIISVGGSLRF